MSQKRLLERKPRLKPVNNEFPSSWFLTLARLKVSMEIMQDTQRSIKGLYRYTVLDGF